MIEGTRKILTKERIRYENTGKERQYDALRSPAGLDDQNDQNAAYDHISGERIPGAHHEFVVEEVDIDHAENRQEN